MRWTKKRHRMATTQMNVRINEDIKAAGDAALASIGLTPSGMVQAIWSYAARNRHNKKALRELAQFAKEDPKAEAKKQRSEAERKHDLVMKGPQIYLDMLDRMGIENPGQAHMPSDDELLYQAYLDKMAERGSPDECNTC